MTEDMLLQVEKWVETSGRALELRVARAIRRAGSAGAELSFTYDDPKEHIPREGDVLAWFPWTGMNQADCGIELVIECKSSGAKPWVAFYDRAMARPGDISDWTYFAHGSFVGLTEPLSSLWQETASFLVPQIASHVATAHDGDRNPAGDAVRQVLSATEARRMVYINSQGTISPRARVIIPAIVTGAPLLTCRLNGSGEVEVGQVDHLVLRGHRPGDQTPCRVYVMNESHLASFAGDLERCALSANEAARTQ